MIAVDSSVVVACFGGWHEHHQQAVEAVRRGAHLPAHAALEAYSVLTRLPEPFRVEPSTVAEYLRRTLPPPRLVLADSEQDNLATRVAGLGIAGGAVYDALIAFTAGAAGAELVTLDERALPIYARCRVRARLLS